jgi:transcriptional regulator with XRE-family HTH domain
METRKHKLLPSTEKLLIELGDNIKKARLRRKLSADQVAERAGISRKTLWNIENGLSGVAIGNCLLALLALGLEKDILKIAADDVLGRKIQDSDLRKRAPKKNR